MFQEDAAERTMKSKKNLGDCVVVHRKFTTHSWNSSRIPDESAVCVAEFESCWYEVVDVPTEGDKFHGCKVDWIQCCSSVDVR